jgi:hypothetical protein
LFNRFPPIDLTSFWFGFLIASAFWLVVTRIIRLVPKLKATIKQNRQIQKSKLQESGESLLRKGILRKCQSSHVASAFFPLNSIYVDLPLILPPIHQDPLKDPPDKSLVQKLIPYIPECPELLIDLPISTFSLSDALAHFKNVAILGEIGSGKTTLLASFASKLIEKNPSVTEYHHLLPLFVHVAELELDETEDHQPMDAFRNSSLPSKSNITYETFHEIVETAAGSSRLLILLDGFDELDESSFLQITGWIKLFLQLYPATRFVVTAAPHFIDGLESLSFSTCFMSPFHSQQRKRLVDQWLIACREIKRIQSSEDSDQIPILWLSQEESKTDILQSSLQNWSHFLLDNSASEKPGPIEEYLSNFVQPLLQINDLVKISEEIFFSKQVGISKNALLNYVRVPSDEMDPGKTENHSKSSINQEISNSAQQIERVLLNCGIFVERRNGFFHLSNPIFFAKLLSQSTRFPLQKNWNILLKAPISELVLRLTPRFDYLINWANSSDEPIYRNFQLLARHFSKLPANSEDRKYILQEISRLLVKKDLPQSIRTRLLLVFKLSDDPSYLMLFKYLFNQRDQVTKQVAVFGFGLGNANDNFQQILSAANDLDSSISNLAAALLSKFWNTNNQKPFIDLLLNGTETTKRVVCELLSFQPGDGLEILKELSTVENISSRKSAIYGIRLINEPWVRPFLEKISIDDKQWVVRDAAIHALETLNENPFANAISPSSKPSETPWLIQYASKTGQGISPNGYPYDLLFKAIDTGTEPEILSAIQFLTAKPDPEVIKELGLLAERESANRDSAADALITIARRGS